MQVILIEDGGERMMFLSYHHKKMIQMPLLNLTIVSMTWLEEAMEKTILEFLEHFMCWVHKRILRSKKQPLVYRLKQNLEQGYILRDL